MGRARALSLLGLALLRCASGERSRNLAAALAAFDSALLATPRSDSVRRAALQARARPPRRRAAHGRSCGSARGLPACMADPPFRL